VDIHKPKPFHSVKEFFSEICVVVIGIAIALGGEQIIERIHWREAIESERGALRADIKDHLRSVAGRVAQQSCVDRRLNELDMVLARHKARQKLGLAGPVGRPQNASSGQEVWQVAIASQALSRMSTDERGRFADAFDNFENFYRIERQADADWIELSGLDRADLLEEADWVALRAAVARLHATEDRIQMVASYVLTEKAAGVPVPSVTLEDATPNEYSKAFCRPLLLK